MAIVLYLKHSCVYWINTSGKRFVMQTDILLFYCRDAVIVVESLSELNP